MRVIPPGDFMMGTSLEQGGLDDERPVHRVVLDREFCVGVFPVTLEEWNTFAAESRGYCPEGVGSSRDRHLVVGVSWSDAKSYCAWLSQKTGRCYRLLSEAEWEYCARAEGGGFAAASTLSCDQFPDCRTAVPVGPSAPNAFGLFDMLGSVWQWVEDLFHSDYTEAPQNGEAWLKNGVAQLRMVRGGSWATEPVCVRPAFRHAACQSQRDFETGFRVACDLSGEVKESVPESAASAHSLDRRPGSAGLDLSLDVSAGRASKSLRAAVSDLTAHSGCAAILREIRAFSMLDIESLAMLHCLGGVVQGGIVEIGPYIGGGTVAIATASSARSAPFVTIEVGGAYTDQPYLPSNDILDDLRTNLIRFGLEGQVFILQGWSHDRFLQRLANRIFERDKIGLLVIDADGQVQATIGSFAPLLRPDCLIVIDDYIAPLALSKQQVVQPVVDRWVARRLLREFGVFGGGTWAGQVNGAAALDKLTTERQIFLPEAGYCFRYFGCDFFIPPDTLQSMAASQLVLREDGRSLGPAHSLHKAIRVLGRGRYSHWGEGNGSSLFFSTSDNSDPNVNGRNYSVEFAGIRFELTGS